MAEQRAARDPSELRLGDAREGESIIDYLKVPSHPPPERPGARDFPVDGEGDSARE